MTRTEQVDRRAAIGAMAMIGSGLAFAGVPTAGQPEADDSLIPIGYDKATGEYVLPPLPYDYDALEPHLDAQTMRVHHGKHHAGYVRGLNAALAALAEARASGDSSLIQHWTKKVSSTARGM